MNLASAIFTQEVSWLETLLNGISWLRIRAWVNLLIMVLLETLQFRKAIPCSVWVQHCPLRDTRSLVICFSIWARLCLPLAVFWITGDSGQCFLFLGAVFLQQSQQREAVVLTEDLESGEGLRIYDMWSTIASICKSLWNYLCCFLHKHHLVCWKGTFFFFLPKISEKKTRIT